MQLNGKDVSHEREENCCFISVMFNSQFPTDVIHEHHSGKVNTPGCQLFPYHQNKCDFMNNTNGRQDSLNHFWSLMTTFRTFKMLGWPFVLRKTLFYIKCIYTFSSDDIVTLKGQSFKWEMWHIDPCKTYFDIDLNWSMACVKPQNIVACRTQFTSWRACLCLPLYPPWIQPFDNKELHLTVTGSRQFD